jgi:hypothetical protein
LFASYYHVVVFSLNIGIVQMYKWPVTGARGSIYATLLVSHHIRMYYHESLTVVTFPPFHLTAPLPARPVSKWRRRQQAKKISRECRSNPHQQFQQSPKPAPPTPRGEQRIRRRGMEDTQAKKISRECSIAQQPTPTVSAESKAGPTYS